MTPKSSPVKLPGVGISPSLLVGEGERSARGGAAEGISGYLPSLDECGTNRLHCQMFLLAC
jgi:hypothetical protein